MVNGRTKNLKMDKRIYGLRREVMGYIYEAKEVVEMPRITVRITDNHESMLGCALMEKDVIWITERAIHEYDLRSIVFHEIAHAVFGADHDEDCPLMKSSIKRTERLSKTKCQQILKKIRG